MRLNLKNMRLFLRMAYNMIFAILLTCFFATVFCKETIAFPELLFIIAAFIVSYVIREITYYNIVVFIVHILMAASSFLMPSALSVKVLLILVCIYLYGSSMAYGKNGGVLKKTDDLPGPAFLLGFLVYFYGWYMKDVNMQEIAYIMQILLIFLYLANVYVDGITRYVENSRELKGLPLRNIISVNTIVVIMITVIMFAALRLADIPDLTGTMRRIGQSIISSLKYAFMFALFLFRWIFFILSGQNVDSENAMSDLYKEQENPGLLTDIIDVLVKLILIALVIYIVFKIADVLKRFIRFVISKRNYCGDLVEVIKIEKKKKSAESTGIIRHITEKLSNEERARRLYRNKVLDYNLSVSLNSNMTALDIRDEVKDKTGDNLTELTELYDKIRYSGENVTGADVKNINILVRRINRENKEE